MTSGEIIAWGRQACSCCEPVGRLNNDGSEGAANRVTSGVRVGACVVDWLDRATPLRGGRVGVGWATGVRGESVNTGGEGALGAGVRITVRGGMTCAEEIRLSLPNKLSANACNITDTEKALAKGRDSMVLMRVVIRLKWLSVKRFWKLSVDGGFKSEVQPR